MDNHKVKFIITGGTIDGLDYEREEDAPKEHQSIIPDLLKQAIIVVDYDIEVLMQKDSRVLTDKDRQLILEKCQSSSEDRIIITHGTATIPETARFLGKANLDKTVILLGAAVPANAEKSDALFNLGAAFIASQLLSGGCMS